MIYAYELSPFAFRPAAAVQREPDPASIGVLVAKTKQILNVLDFDPRRALYRRIVERIANVRREDAKLFHSVLNRLREHLTP
jgi:hypothetical protein